MPPIDSFRLTSKNHFVGLLPPPAPPPNRNGRRRDYIQAPLREPRAERLILAALASDEDGAIDLGSTRRLWAKAIAAETVLGKGTAEGVGLHQDLMLSGGVRGRWRRRER
jgi:hypothetical protein